MFPLANTLAPLKLGGKAPDWTPLSLGASLMAWYKADAQAYVDNGVTLATNGQTVQLWKDQSVNGRDLSQATSNLRPTYNAPVGGSVGYILFSNKWMYSAADFLGGLAKVSLYFLHEYYGGAMIFSTSGIDGLELYKSAESHICYYQRRAKSKSVDLPDESIHEYIYDGTQGTPGNRIKICVDKLDQYNSSAGGTDFPTTIPSGGAFRIGISGDGQFAAQTLRLKEVVIVPDVLDAATRTQLTTYLQKRQSQGTRNMVWCVSDSIGITPYGANSYPDKLQTDLGSGYFVAKFGKGGETLYNLNSYLTGGVYPAFTRVGDICCVLMGSNDLTSSRTAVQIEGYLTTMWAFWRGKGCKVVAATIHNRTTFTAPMQAERATLNTWILGQTDKWDAVADLAAQAELSDPLNATYFSDGVHPTAAGATVIKNQFLAAINTL